MIERGKYNQTTEIIGIALFVDSINRGRNSLSRFFLIVLNTLWLGLRFT